MKIRTALRIFLYLILFLCLPVIIHGTETNSLTLKDAITRALNNNKGIAAAREKVREAEAGKIIAQAKFFPSLSLSASYTRLAEAPGMEFAFPVFGTLRLPVFDPLGNPTGDYVIAPGITGFETYTYSMGSENIYTLRTSFQYPLFTWWKISNAYKIALLNLELAKEDLKKKENELVLAVTESFLQVQLAKKGLELALESREQLSRHVKQAEDLYNAGKISRFDFLRTKVQLASINVQVLQSENALLLAKDMLKNLLDMNLESNIDVSDEIEYSTCTLSLNEAMEFALKNRPEIKAMDITVKIAEKSLAIAKAGNKPNLVLAGNYDYKNPDSSGKEQWGTDWSIILSVNIPLFQGGENIGKVKQAEAQLRQAELGLEQLIKGINTEVRNAFLQMHSSQSLLVSQQENIMEAEEALKIAESRYAAGLITNLEYLDAQIALNRAKIDYLKTLINYLIAEARLKKATGQQ